MMVIQQLLEIENILNKKKTSSKKHVLVNKKFKLEIIMVRKVSWLITD
jgi:hypothetical protein